MAGAKLLISSGMWGSTPRIEFVSAFGTMPGAGRIRVVVKFEVRTNSRELTSVIVQESALRPPLAGLCLCCRMSKVECGERNTFRGFHSPYASSFPWPDSSSSVRSLAVYREHHYFRGAGIAGDRTSFVHH